MANKNKKMGKKSVKIKELLKNNLMSLVLVVTIFFAVFVIAGDVIVRDGNFIVDENSTFSGEIKFNGGTQDYLWTNRGDFLSLQGQSAATASFLEIYSNDGDGTDGSGILIYGTGTPTDTDPAERVSLFWSDSDGYFTLRTQELGTGTIRNLSIGNTDFPNALFIQTDGNVGIGTSTPDKLLHIQDAASAVTLKVENTQANSKAILSLKNDAQTWNWFVNTNDNIVLFDITNNKGVINIAEGTPQLFTTTTTRLTINDDGADFDLRVKGDIDVDLLFINTGTDRVGIGTSSPTHKLNVVGDLNVTGTIFYGALQAQSPHFLGIDNEVGYTRSCWYDSEGYYNLVWFEGGTIQVETNSQRCIDKKAAIDAEVEDRPVNTEVIE